MSSWACWTSRAAGLLYQHVPPPHATVWMQLDGASAGHTTSDPGTLSGIWCRGAVGEQHTPSDVCERQPT